VVITPASAGSGLNRKLLIIGDSTTASGRATAELANLFTTNVMGLTLIGTQGSGSNRHEGHTGWTYQLFAQATNSPFVFNGNFDFARYLSTNNFSMSSGDWVIFNLGINDVYFAVSDTNALSDCNTIWQYVSTMVANIQSTVPGVRIGICMTIPPAPSQDGFGVGNRYGIERDRYLRNRGVFNSYVISHYASLGQNVYVIPLSAAVDEAYGFQSSLQPVSLRVTNMVMRYTDGIHPSDTGYFQIADMYYHFLKGNEK
jgi:lysophospholipase L1-like esterase